MNDHGWEAWHKSVSYNAFEIARASDGNHYRTVAAHSNQSPLTDGGNYWELVEARNSMALDVGTGQRFSSFAAAWAFVRNAKISQAATVTINLRDGVYNFTNPLNLTHPEGNRLQIVGNQTNPQAVVLNFTSCDGLQIFENAMFGYINGVRIVGNASSVTRGVLCQQARLVLGPNVQISGFGTGLRAVQNADVTASNVTISNCTGFGIAAERGATVLAVSAVISNIGTSTTGTGLQSIIGSTVRADSAQVSYCAESGFLCGYGSSLYAPGCRATFCGWGVGAVDGSYAYVINCQTGRNTVGFFAGNGGRINRGGTTVISGNNTQDYNVALNSPTTNGAVIW